MAGEGIIKMMQQIAKDSSGVSPNTVQPSVVFGEVVSVSPLKVKVGMLVLDGSFVKMSPFCVKKEVEYVNQTHTHKHVIWEGIKPGDKVFMLKTQNTYIILFPEVL